MKGTAIYTLAILVLSDICAWAIKADDISIKFATDFVRVKQIRHVMVVACSQEEAILWERILARQGDVMVFSPKHSDVLQALSSSMWSMGICLQFGCQETLEVLRQSSQYGLLNSTFHWLIFGGRNSTRQDLVEIVQNLNLSFDSDVTLAVPSLDEEMHLFQAHRLSNQHPVNVELTATWPVQRDIQYLWNEQPSSKMRSLKGGTVRIGVLTDEVKSNLTEELSKDKSDNSAAAPVVSFGHVLTQHLRSLLNVTVLVRVASKENLTSINDVDIIATPITMQEDLWNYLDYSFPLWTNRCSGVKYRIALKKLIVLKNINSLSSEDAWIKPFHWTVWLGVVLASLGMLLVIRIVGCWEVRFNALHQQEEDSWSSAVMTTTGIICAQGFTNTSEWIGGRMALFTFELFSLFIGIFYSSSMVTFLLVLPQPTVHSIQDLISTSVRVCVDRNAISTNTFVETSDPLVRNLYSSKVASEESFVHVNVGAELARDFEYAIISSTRPLYSILGSTWSNEDICRMQQIQLVPSDLLAMASAKKSSFREILNLRHFCSLLLLLERGLVARERLRWTGTNRKPECLHNEVRRIDGVAWRPVAPVFGILVSGIGFSILILLVEICVSSFESSRPTLPRLLGIFTVKEKRKKFV